MKRQRPQRPWSQALPPPRTGSKQDVFWDLRLIWRTQWRSWLGQLRANPEQTWGTALLALLAVPLFSSVWLVTFSLHRQLFVNAAPGPQDAAAVTAVTTGSFVFAALLTLARAGTALAHSGSVPLLLTLPVRRGAMLTGIGLQLWAAALWAPLFALAPTLALLTARTTLWPGLAAVLLAALGTSLIVSAGAVFLGATVARWLPTGRWQEWSLIITGTAGLGLWFGFQWFTRGAPGSVSPSALLALVGQWLPQWLPAGWPAVAASVVAQRGPGPGLLAGVAFLVVGGWGAVLLLVTLDRMYRDGWAVGKGRPATRDAIPGAARRGLVARWGWRRQPALALCRRELRRLWRTPRLLSQGLFSLAPMLFPLFLDNPLGDSGQALRAGLPAGIAFVSTVLAGLMVGSEEAGFWITRLAPLRDLEIVVAKAGAVAILFGSLGIGAATGLGLALGWTGPSLVLSALHVASAVIAGSSIGLLAGCRNPVFRPLTKPKHLGACGGIAAAFGVVTWSTLCVGAYAGLRWWLAPRWGIYPVEALLSCGVLIASALLAWMLLRAAAAALPNARLDR